MKSHTSLCKNHINKQDIESEIGRYNESAENMYVTDYEKAVKWRNINPTYLEDHLKSHTKKKTPRCTT